MHASSTLPAFVLSQNQTLHKEILRPRAAPSRAGRADGRATRRGPDPDGGPSRSRFLVCFGMSATPRVAGRAPSVPESGRLARRRVANLLYRAMAFGFQRACGSVRLGGRLLPGRPRGSAATLGGRCLSCGDGSLLYTRRAAECKGKFHGNAFCLQVTDAQRVANGAEGPPRGAGRRGWGRRERPQPRTRSARITHGAAENAEPRRPLCPRILTRSSQRTRSRSAPPWARWSLTDAAPPPAGSAA